MAVARFRILQHRSDGPASGGLASGGLAPGGLASGGLAPGGLAPGGLALGGLAPGGLVSWRLLATNNRDLGRAPVTYQDPATCRAAVLRLQRQAADLRPAIVRAGPSSWRWQITAGMSVVAVSSRDYQRRIQAEQAAAIVLTLIPAAELVGLA